MPRVLFWMRRDLRMVDNAALYHALKNHDKVMPIFIFDTNILQDLKDRSDARVTFIYQQLNQLKSSLQKQFKSDLKIYYGQPLQILKQIFSDSPFTHIYTNRDYEPYAKSRDESIAQWSKSNQVEFLSFKDHVIFESKEVTKADGNPYLVYTPFYKNWLQQLNSNGVNEQSRYLQPFPCSDYFDHFEKLEPSEMISWQTIEFVENTAIQFPSREIDDSMIVTYHDQRDFPALHATSQLGVHLRFGTISIRQVFKESFPLSETFVKELVWREFYSVILDSFPRVVDESFYKKYDKIQWRNNPDEFELWKKGQTGYPLVDAGMRQLNKTGYMHNRVRMVVASFLTKHLLIDWRWGEAYFAEKLLDFELASNNGGWQWAAGTGTDAAPYFRIFNPESQMKKFDKDKLYIRKWVSEYGTKDYPEPIVDHKEARVRALEAYKRAT